MSSRLTGHTGAARGTQTRPWTRPAQRLAVAPRRHGAPASHLPAASPSPLSSTEPRARGAEPPDVARGLPCDRRDGCARCARGSGRRELLQASWWRVEVPPPRRACHAAQATGGWLHRIGKQEMELRVQVSGRDRSDVAQHCRQRGHFEHRNVMSVVVNGSKPDLLRAARDGVPGCGGRTSGADRCPPPESRAGERRNRCCSAALKPTLSRRRP